MTSEERKEARYQRRKAKREAKAQKYAKTFDEVFSFGNLMAAGKRCCNGVRWKASAINFEVFLARECAGILAEIRSGKHAFRGFQSFTTIEHGKARDIDALPIRQRAAQKCLCQNLLTEMFSHSFVYDNAASLPGRGMDFALKRLKKHLRDHYRKHGTKGGIYQFDFKGYFLSIPHEGIKKRLREKIADARLCALAESYVDDFRKMKTAPKEARGVGLGSEISQIIALDYASPIDHYIKDVCGIKGYGRYMDDGYVISGSLTELERIKGKLYELAKALGLRMNDKKNVITPFEGCSFKFLKMRVTLRESGRVTIKPSRQSLKTIRRKIVIFRRWLDAGKMKAEDVFQSYQSWRAHARRAESYGSLKTMDARFAALFGAELAARKLRFPCTLNARRFKNGWVYTPRYAGRRKAWNTSAIGHSGE